MRVVVQRVSQAAVRVGDRITGEIGPGLLVLAGFEAVDGEADLVWMCRKLSQLRLFPDGDGLMNRSVMAADGGILAVSQFTLYASTRKGNRPSWSRAAPGPVSEPLFARFVALRDEKRREELRSLLWDENRDRALLYEQVAIAVGYGGLNYVLWRPYTSFSFGKEWIGQGPAGWWSLDEQGQWSRR